MQVQYSVLFCLFVTAMADKVPKTSAYPNVIVLSMGAVSLSMLEKHMPEIKKYLVKYASAEYLLPVMPTKGPVNHMSIATGLYPDGHGVINDCRYDEDEKCVYRQVTNKKPIWITNLKRGGFSAAMNWPGAEFSRDELTYYQNDEYDLQKNREEEIDERITTIKNWLRNENKPANLVMVYYGELDKFLHRNSAFLEKGQMELKYAQYFITKLISKLESAEITDVNLIVLGSHGGKIVNEEKGINLNDILNEKYDSPFDAMGAIAIVTPKEEELANVYNHLDYDAKKTGRYNVYYQVDIPENWHLKEMPLLKDKIFLVANMDYFFWNFFLQGIKEKQRPNKLVALVDGYNTEESLTQTFFMAMGPNFVSPIQVPAFNTIDVYQLLRKLLKLPEINKQKLSDDMNKLLKPEGAGLRGKVTTLIRTVKGKWNILTRRV